MAKWEDLPGELHAQIWDHFRDQVIKSLTDVDNKPFETYVAECTAELSEEERKREEERMHEQLTKPHERIRGTRADKCFQAYKKAKAAEEASDRLAIEHALLISKNIAWSLRGQLKDRLETMIKLGKTINDKYFDLYYAHGFDHQPRAPCLYGLAERDITAHSAHGDGRQSSEHLASFRYVLAKDCSVPEDTWDQIEHDKYGFDKYARVGDEVREDLRRRIFRLSMVSKSLAAPVAHVLADVVRHLDGQKAHQQHEVDYADGALYGSEYDSTGSKSAALARADIWLRDLTILHNYAHKLYFVVSCWAVDSRSKEIHHKLRLQITRECLKLPKLRILKQIIHARNYQLRWEGQRYEHTWEEDSTREEFEPCHEGLQKLSLLTRCCPSAWLVKALRKHSARLPKLSGQIDELLSWGHYDWKVADLDWEGRIKALRDEVEALLSKVCTWAAESW